MPLFIKKEFFSSSGLKLGWKIECDRPPLGGMTKADWEAIADICAPHLPLFGWVIGIPQGGLPLADEFKRYAVSDTKLTLIVDDVWTTGRSILNVGLHHIPWIGFVAFARGARPENVFAFMTTTW